MFTVYIRFIKKCLLKCLKLRYHYTDPASDTGWKKAGSFENITYSPSTGTGTNRAATFEFDPVEALKVKIVVRESYSSGSGQEPENQYANALEITTYAVNDVPEDKLEIGVTLSLIHI